MLRELIQTFALFKSRNDDDLVDRMHYFFTPNLLIAFAALVSFKQFGGRPIECLIPDLFPSAWEQYAENYCWSQDTYFISMTQQVLRSHPEAKQNLQHITYYKWVPFFLLAQAVCFIAPMVFFRCVSEHSGIRVENMITMAVDKNNIRPEIRTNTIKIVVTHLANALDFHRRRNRRDVVPHRVFRCLNLPYSSSYVTKMYLTTKIAFLLNVAGQWILLNFFLGTSDHYDHLGFEVLLNVVNGTAWQTGGVFPRVTLCDFSVRMLGSNSHQYTMQCILMINLFNEKIFIFLWLFYVVLTLVTVLSLLYWFGILVVPQCSRWFIARHLELSSLPFDTNAQHKDLYRFVNDYLHADGVFVLRMIAHHTGVIFSSDVISALWQRYFGAAVSTVLRGPSPDSDGGRKLSVVSDQLLRKKSTAKSRKEWKGRKEKKKKSQEKY